MNKTILMTGFLFLTQFATAQGVPQIKNGYYNISDGSKCTYRVASYPDVSTVIVNIADSVDGYFCPYRSTIYKFKCETNSLCNFEGRKLHVLGADRLILEFPNGIENDLTFAATQIPEANKFVVESSWGWELTTPDALVKTKRGWVHFRELETQDIIDAELCKMATQEAEQQAVRECQNKNFYRCTNKRRNSQMVVKQQRGINLFTGCTSEVMVQGSK